MNLTGNLFPQDLVQALGWALLHSLWQGAAMAVLLSVVLMAMRKSSSAHRYLASAGAMVLLLGLVAGTFIWLYNPATPQSAGAGVFMPQQPHNQALQAGVMQSGSSLKTTLAFVAGFFDSQLPLLVLAWVLGALFMLLRMLGGLVLVQRMRSHKLHQHQTAQHAQ